MFSVCHGTQGNIRKEHSFDSETTDKLFIDKFLSEASFNEDSRLV